MIEIDYKKATALDPLNIDADLFHLPEHNAKIDTIMIRQLGTKAVRNFYRTDVANNEAAYAILRDFDFIASSLDRHGLNPMVEVDGLEDAMIQAGFAGNSVPRGTITTYSSINPDGEQRRSFTGSQEENVFIDSLKTSFYALEVALNGLARLTVCSDRVDVTHALDTSTAAMQEMTNSMISVMRNISPAIFTTQIPKCGSEAEHPAPAGVCLCTLRE
jgi:hypothetical protein